jgi:hypothetical protein
MLDKMGCFAMGFVFAIVLGLVNTQVRAEVTDSECVGCALQEESIPQATGTDKALTTIQ